MEGRQVKKQKPTAWCLEGPRGKLYPRTVSSLREHTVLCARNGLASSRVGGRPSEFASWKNDLGKYEKRIGAQGYTIVPVEIVKLVN